MTNGELIEKLQQYPKEAKVLYTVMSPLGKDVEMEPDPYFNEISKEIYL